MKTTMTVGAILAALVATPLVARGQTLTAVVNRTNVHDSASFDIGDDLTEVFLGALCEPDPSMRDGVASVKLTPINTLRSHIRGRTTDVRG